MTESKYITLMENIRDSCTIVDLSHVMEEHMPAWPTQARYGSTVYESYDFGDPAIHSAIYMSEHTGTHIDAPKHFIRNGCPVDKLDIKTVMGRGVTIPAENCKPCGLFTLDQVQQFEHTYGAIRRGDIIMFHFGWDKKWALQPDCADFLRDWPGLDGAAATYFADRRVAAVGCDTLSLDAFGADDNVCHKILLGSGIPIIENICNLPELPVFSYVVGLPNKFKGGSGSPIRMAAFIQQENQKKDT